MGLEAILTCWDAIWVGLKVTLTCWEATCIELVAMVTCWDAIWMVFGHINKSVGHRHGVGGSSNTLGGNMHISVNNHSWEALWMV